eukprot:jgi/Chlat1/6020/Chrsp4S00487
MTSGGASAMLKVQGDGDRRAPFGHMGLVELPDEVLAIGVLARLEPADVASCAAVCRRLGVLCGSDLLWNAINQKRFAGELPAGVVAEWRLAVPSSRALFRLLRACIALTGTWALLRPPRGGLLHVGFSGGLLRGSRVVPDPADSSGRMHLKPYLRLQGDALETDGHSLRTELLGNPLPARMASLRVHGHDRFELVPPEDSAEADTGSGSQPNDNTASPFVPDDGNDASRSLLLHHLLSILQNHPGDIQLPPLPGPVAAPAAAREQDGESASVSFGRIPLLPYDEQRPLQGLWHGLYGPHGVEVLYVSYVEGYIQGRKVTGDANVPAGEVSWRADSSTLCSNPPRDAMEHALLGDAATGGNGGVLHMLGADWRVWENLRVVESYLGKGRVAGHNFEHPQWVDGRLWVCQDRHDTDPSKRTFVFLWGDYNFLIKFSRIHLDGLSGTIGSSAGCSVTSALAP